MTFTPCHITYWTLNDIGLSRTGLVRHNQHRYPPDSRLIQTQILFYRTMYKTLAHLRINWLYRSHAALHTHLMFNRLMTIVSLFVMMLY